MNLLGTRIGILLIVLLGAGVGAEVEVSRRENARPADATAMSALFGAQDFQQAEISPDGKQVAWVESVIEKGGSRSSDTAIYSVDLSAPAEPVRVTAENGKTTGDEHGLAWS